jgi:predicted N-acetyltransferase YhbS
MPEYSALSPAPDSSDLIELFRTSFTESEGHAEGTLIARFAEKILTATPQEDLFVYVARHGTDLCGCAIFSRVMFEDDPRDVFILSPMAVAPDCQGQGVGQALIQFALQDLQRRGVEVALTYGDPNFYGKVGFEPVSEARVPPPLPLSHPEGWIGQSLTDAPFSPFTGPCKTVEALRDPALW